jgi:hypothetical protein
MSAVQTLDPAEDRGGRWPALEPVSAEMPPVQ